MSHAVDVVIVGAGLAGLSAARALEVMQYRVVVVDARDRVGGRLLTQIHQSGAALDLGGQWVGPGQNRLLSLAGELGIKTFPTFNDGKTVLDWNGRLKRFVGEIPKVGPVALIDLAQAQARLDSQAQGISLGAPWESKTAARLDAETFESWIRRNAHTPGARKMLRLYARSVFAAEAGEFSALHALFYTHSGHSSARLSQVAAGAQEARFVGGAQQICERMAANLAGEVILETPVREIEQDKAGVVVRSDKSAFPAQRAIVAIPPALTNAISFIPKLPAARAQLIQRVPPGSVIKAMAVFDKPFWREEGLNGQAISDHGPVRIVFDNSPPEGAPGILVGFFEGEEARRFMGSPIAARRAAFLDCLARFFGPAAREPDDYIDLDWSEELWTRGCYGAHFPPGVWTAYGPALRAPFDRVHWAGTETAVHWNGYMDGAIESGVRAADEVMTEV